MQTGQKSGGAVPSDVQPSAGRDAMATVATATERAEEKKPQTRGERKPQRRIDEKLKIFSGTANPALADEICRFLGIEHGQAQVTRFSDGEAYVHLMELLLMIDALKRASARRITPVVPYFGYARQDRKDKPRSPISAKLVADLLTTAGADRALIVDLHAPQLQGFFNIPVDHLFASPVL